MGEDWMRTLLKFLMIASIVISFTGCNNNDKEIAFQVSSMFEPNLPYTLTVPFRILNQGKLVVDRDHNGGGFPLEAFERLYLESPKKSERIDDMANLKGKVIIQTPDQALAFVRLMTSPRTYLTWHTYGVNNSNGEQEAVIRGQVTEAFCFGDKKMSKDLRNTESGYLGIISNTFKMRLAGIRKAKVRVVKQGFEVRRTLKGHEGKLLAVKETIGFDGSYSRIVIKKRNLPKSIDWHFPMYE
jgi:hypothetical protein